MSLAADEASEVLRLRVRSESLTGEALVVKLTEALRQHTGKNWSLQVRVGEVSDSVALRETRRRERRQAQAEAMIRQDRLVQDLLGQFPGAQLVPGSVRPLDPPAQ
ncbi:MAG: hypothetical protein EBT24_01090 [Betaproteobacteria bacterium]|nr:hypothetical protein [Betaproteobacteria bacterium]